VKCEFQIERNPAGYYCSLGFYGGEPDDEACRLCIELGQNNVRHAIELAARAERSHPSTAKRVSGCCDSAKNYI
jgi:hypothetical protein